MKSNSIQSAMNRERRKELATLRRDSKAAASDALRKLTALRKEADKVIRLHQKADAARARRIAILEGRLG
jgi:hypothetical protein